VIVRWEGPSRFAVSNTLELVKGETSEAHRIRRLRDYAIAHNMRVTPAEMGLTSDYYLKEVVKESLDLDAFTAVLEKSTTEDATTTAPARYLREALPWLELPADTEKDYLPLELKLALAQALRRFAPEPQPEPAATSSTEGDPNDIVYVVGDTKAHKDKIKQYGRDRGAYCKWLKYRTAWAIKRRAWRALIRDYAWLDGKLSIEES